jgi:aminopeptidase-like protein
VTTDEDIGADMHRWATDLWPLHRSLTGAGVRATLAYLNDLLPDLRIHEVPSGTQAFDWTVPDEWNLLEAWVEDATGRRVIDTARTNLHVVGYAEPFDGIVSREELLSRVHTLPDQLDAIPYVTSYYRRTWGFCMAHEELEGLGDGPFRVHIDTTLEPGHLTYADLVIPGDSTDEVLLSTYVCHPSMANNELSGPIVTAALGRWIASLPSRRYTYRIVFIPETIGSILYLSRHLEHLREHVKAGWVLTCIGDDRAYSYVPSRLGGTLADRVSLQALRDRGPFDEYTFLDRGSDERQWCSPGAELPVCSVMRSKYGRYPEYHTSLDDLDAVVTPTGLQGGFDILKDCITLLEANKNFRTVQPGEPQLGRHNLYPTPLEKGVRRVLAADVLAYCDGNHDLIDLCSRTALPWNDVLTLIQEFEAAGLIEVAQ